MMIMTDNGTEYLLSVLAEAKKMNPDNAEWQEAIATLEQAVREGHGPRLAEIASALTTGRSVGTTGAAELVVTEDGRLLYVNEDGTTTVWENEE